MYRDLKQKSAKPQSMKERYAGMYMTNPVIRKMSKLAVQTGESDGIAATYRGIAGKTIFFLVMTIIGIGVYFGLHNYFLAIGPTDAVISVQENIFDIHIHMYEAAILAFAGILVLFAPLLAWLIRPTIPVTGTIYTFCQGFFIGCVSEFLEEGYKWIGLLAMVLTVAVVAVMLFLYVKRIIKVTGKFKKIITTLFISLILSGIVIFILGLIPGVRNIVDGFSEIMQNPVISILCSIGYIIIASLFLLADFDTIESCVENNMPKKYEWMAAFGLAYTVIYIYFKILNLLIRIFGSAKNND